MKKVLFLAILICSFAFVLKGQEANLILPKVGIGLHIEQFKLNDISDLDQAPVNKFMVVINPSQLFRIEPEIGYKSGTTSEAKYKAKTLNLGIGGFVQFQKNKLNLYGGFRFEYGIMSLERGNYNGNGDIKEKSTRIMMGPALGGEYYFIENFSFGGEISLMKAFLKKSYSPETNGDRDYSNEYASTMTGLFIRFYF